MLLFNPSPAVRIQTNRYKSYFFAIRCNRILMFDTTDYTQFKIIKLGYYDSI